MAKVNPTFEFEVMKVAQKDSTELTPEDREMLLKACRETDAEKILVTHGTDTMVETASSLQNIQGKVIVITGAMRPEKFSDSDADFNVGVAIGALNVLKEGVYIAMNGQVIAWNRCGRNLETGQFIVR